MTCNGHSVKNISLLVKKPKMELLFILYEHLVHLLNYKAVNNHQNKKCHNKFFENINFF